MGAGRAAVMSVMLTGLGVTVVALVGAAAPLRAGGASQAGEAAGEARQAAQAATGEGAGGGRDPFERPLAPVSRSPVEVRAAGLSGLSVDEVVLRGVVAIRGRRLAVLEGPDARAHVVRPGDRLHDGRVQEITPDGVLFRRDAADSVPTAERVVRMGLRDSEGAR